MYYLTDNYRRLHITSVLSKVAERLIANQFSKFVQQHFGMNQWAYRKGRGAKDLLCFLIASWVLNICSQKKIGVYTSDIVGAFDRVFSAFLGVGV